MTNLNLPLQDKLWLYNSYRAALKEDAPTVAKVEIKNDSYQSLYDPEHPEEFAIFDKDWIKFSPQNINNDSAAIEKLLISLHREGVALAHIFESDEVKSKMSDAELNEINKSGIFIDGYWNSDKTPYSIINESLKSNDQKHKNNKFDEIAGRIHVVKALEAIRHQAVLVFAHDTGQITQEQFESNLDKLNHNLDLMGFNGIHRMIEANPSLKEQIKQDKRFMIPDREINNKLIESDKPEWIDPNKKIERGEYYTKVSEYISGNKTKEEQLTSMMAGSDYAKAYNEHNQLMREYSKKARNDIDLNRSASELIDTISDSSRDHSEQLEAYRICMINYGLGSRHEIIKIWNERQNNPATQEVIKTPKLLTTTEVDKLEPEDTQKKTGLSELVEKSGQKLESNGEILPKESQPEAKKTNVNNSSSKKSSDKSNNDAVIGQVLTTTVLGGIAAHGANRLASQEKDKEHNKFWNVVEVAAAVVGIALVWQNRELFNNAINRFRG